MSIRLAATLSDQDMPLAELYSARLDGELIAIAECFSPIDTPDDRHHRATALARTFQHRLIAERLSAAWVLGASPLPPARHQACAESGARVSSTKPRAYELREVVIDDTEFIHIGELRVTTPLRTATDIARSLVDFGDPECDIITALMRLGSFGLSDCLRAMSRRRNLPDKQRALERIHTAETRLDHPPVTR